MPFQTQQLKMEIELFESMIHNIGKTMRKMKTKITFKKLEEKIAFMGAIQNKKNRDAGLDIQLIESQEQNETQQIKQVVNKKKIQDQKPHSIKITFELSVLLKSNFQKQINQIEKKYDVKFLIVPQKVKIYGQDKVKIEEADDEYHQMVTNIILKPIAQNGEKIYQSQYCLKELQKLQIYIIEIHKKYYAWYFRNKNQNFAQISRIFQKIFCQTIHHIYHLNKSNIKENGRYGCASQYLSICQQTYKKDRQYRPLITEFKAKLFESHLERKINELVEDPSLKIELSRNRQSLIIHIEAAEQIFMQETRLHQLYNQYSEFFISYSADVDIKEIQSVIKILEKYSKMKYECIVFADNRFEQNENNQYKKKMNLISSKRKTIFCIGFKQTKKYDSNLDDHPLVRLIKDIPKQQLNFKVSLSAEQKAEINLDQRFIVDFDSYESLIHISPKNITLQRYIEIIKQFVIKKEHKKKYIPQNNIDNTINEITMVSERIESSSLAFENEPINEESKLHGNILPEDINQCQEKRLKIFELTYNISIEQKKQDVIKRYAKEDIKNLEKSQNSIPQKELQNKLLNWTGLKFKVYRTFVPKQFQINLQQQAKKAIQINPELQTRNREITVFALEKQNLYQNKSIIVHLLGKGEVFKKSGYLLNTNLVLLQPQGKQYELKFKTYEVIRFIKYIP